MFWDLGVRSRRKAWKDPAAGFAAVLAALREADLALFRYMDPEQTHVDVYEFRPDLLIDDLEGGFAPFVRAEQYRPGFDKPFTVHLFRNASDALLLAVGSHGGLFDERRRASVGESTSCCAVLVSEGSRYSVWDHRQLSPSRIRI